MKNLSLLFIAFLLVGFNALAQAPDTLWTKTFGGTGDDSGNSVRQTIDGGYIIVGSSLIKADTDGNELWSKNIEGNCVQQTSDSGYIIVGDSLIKTDTDGNAVWNKNIDGNYVQQTTDEGYIITGSFDGSVELIKTDTSGDTLWRKTFRNFSNSESGYFVQQTSDGGYVVMGTTSGPFRAWLIKTDSFGDSIWTKTYSGPAWTSGNSGQQTNDGGYIVLADYGSIWLIKTDSLGDTLWTKIYSELNYEERGYEVQQTSDGGYIIVGGTESFGAGGWDVWIIKTDSSGDTTWTKTLGGSENDFGYSIQQTTDGGYIVAGVTGSFGAGNGDVWLIKLAPDPNDVENENQIGIPSNYVLKQNYPNPFNPNTTINYQIPELSFVTIKIYDVLGSEVAALVNEEKQTGAYELTWNAENLPSGIYFYRLQAGAFIETKKMVLMK